MKLTLPHMQRTAKIRTEIQDALKSVSVQNFTKNYSTKLKTSGNEATPWRMTLQEKKIHQV